MTSYDVRDLLENHETDDRNLCDRTAVNAYLVQLSHFHVILLPNATFKTASFDIRVKYNNIMHTIL